MMWWSIDGIEWSFPCRVTRIAEMTPSQISGMLLNKLYFNDVIGTWLKYDIAIAVPFGREVDYAKMYEKLTEPVGFHTFVLPYNNDFVTITGRIVSYPKDALVKIPGNQNYWKGCTFSVAACNPTKTQSLSEAISYGLPPWPQTVELPVGSVWEYTATGWQAYDAPPDADNIYY